MTTEFLGFDHIDTRVWSLAVTESFYDQLMPKLGLPRKRHAYVDENGDWFDAPDGERYNAVEYYEPKTSGAAVHFIGFIEDSSMQPVGTRIAFRIASPDDLAKWWTFLNSVGAINIERSADPVGYPAIFFEDPCGTKLEICCRQPEK